MNKNKIKSLEEILFKPLVKKEGKETKLFIIIGCNVNTNLSLSQKGKIERNYEYSVEILDVFQTLNSESSIINLCHILDVDEFKAQFQIDNGEKYQQEINESFGIIINELNYTQQRCLTLVKSLTTLRFVSPETKDKGQLSIAGNNGILADVVYRTITGDIASLDRKDVDKLGNVIMDVIIHNLDVDQQNEELVKKLKAEIEYKLVEALPVGMQAGNIVVNMAAILNEINKFNGKNLKLDDNIDDNSNENDEEDMEND